MSIVEKAKILQAYKRAIALGANHEEACATVARALCIDVEIVAQVVRPEEEAAA